MKNAAMFHGGGENPNSFWYPSVKRFLETQGFVVWSPRLPELKPDTPELRVQLPYVLENGKFSEDTVIVSHSAGCPLALSVLENINVKVKRAILVAGFSRPLKEYPNPILQETYDWEKIRRGVGDIYFINSDNDPWGCDEKEGGYMFQHLGGTLIVRHGEGHMGSRKYGQPYRDFPLLEKLLTLP